jgi:hypothetical protein
MDTAGLPFYGAETTARPSQSFDSKNDSLTGTYSLRAELSRLLMDMPGTFQLVDIRPSRLMHI